MDKESTDSLAAPGEARESVKPNILSFALLMLGIVLVVIALSCHPNPSTDLYWQLRTGREILETKSVPHFDSYSWTRNGSPWVAQEWLSCVLFWLSYKMGHGFAGLLIFKTILLAINVAIFYLYIARTSGYKLIPAYLLTLCAAYPLSVGFQARPQIFTYLFVTITAFAVLTLRQNGRTRIGLWWLVPMYVLWANLHSGVYLGVSLLLVWAVGDIIDRSFGRQKEAAIQTGEHGLHLLCVAVLCFLGTLINPYGIHELANLTQTVLNRAAMNSVSEWTSPSLHDAVGINFAAVAALCLLGMMYSKKKAGTADFIVVAALFHFALYSLRNIPVFALAGVMTAAPYFFSCISGLLPLVSDPDTNDITPRSIFGQNPRLVLVTVGVSGFFCISVLSTMVDLMLNLDWLGHPKEPVITRLSDANVELSANPAEAVTELKTGLVPRSWKMYNIYGSGGYLIWTLPDHRVSIDGRADVYFGDVLDNYLYITQWPYDWKKVVAKNPPDFILTASDEIEARPYMSSPDWAIVYVDSPDLNSPFSTLGGYNAMIFVRRSKVSNSELVAMRHRCPTILSPNFTSMYRWYPAVH